MFFVPADYKLYSKLHGGWISALNLSRGAYGSAECWDGTEFVPVSLEEAAVPQVLFEIDSVTKIGLAKTEDKDRIDFDFHWKAVKERPEKTGRSEKQVLRAVLDFCTSKAIDHGHFVCKVPRARALAVGSLLPTECEMFLQGKRYTSIRFPCKSVSPAPLVEKPSDSKKYIQTAIKLAGKCIRCGIYVVVGRHPAGFRRLRRKLYTTNSFLRNSQKVYTAVKTKELRAKICTRKPRPDNPSRHFKLHRKSVRATGKWVAVRSDSKSIVVEGVRLNESSG